MLQRPLRLLGSSEPSYAAVVNLLRAADLRIGNLEQCLFTRGAPQDKLATIRGAPALAREVKSLGLDVVGVANNHACDYGEMAFLDTLAACTEAGLTVVGGGHTLAAAVEPVTFTSGGRSVAVLAFSATLPPGAAAGVEKPGVAPVRVTTRYEVDPIFTMEQPGTSPRVRTQVLVGDVQLLVSAVARARAAADRVVVLLHWGVPPYWHPPFDGELVEYQRPLAHEVAAAGADVILGHHPHVVHGIEVVGACAVCYSLGNFIFHPRVTGSVGDADMAPGYKAGWTDALRESAGDPRKRDSALVEVNLASTGPPRLTVFPLHLDERGEPRVPDDDVADRVLDRLQRSSQQLGTTLRVSAGAAHLDAA
jgi:poly-gamma-glutamate synthesis protein (capsule biosynthesis protein)